MTPFQLDESANAPWTSTTVGAPRVAGEFWLSIKFAPETLAVCEATLVS